MRVTERIFFRHITQKLLALRQQGGDLFVQSAEKISRSLARSDLIIASLKILALCQQSFRFFVQSDEKSNYAIRTPQLCGIALK